MGAVFRAAFAYFFLVFMVRIVGRRPGKQMNPFEFVLIFFIGGLALTFTVSDDKSLVNAISQIITIAVCHYALVFVRKHSRGGALLLDGPPVVLMSKGQWHEEVMKGMLIQQEDVMTAARDKGIYDLQSVDYVVLERNGEITISSSR